MKNKFLSRTVAAILLIITLIPLIVACADTADVKVKVENVFKTESITLPETFQPSGQLYYMNDRIYLQGYSIPDYKTTLCSVKRDGTDQKFTDLVLDNPNAYINSINIQPNGNITYIYNEYIYDEVTFQSSDTAYIINIDSDGNELLNLNLTDMFRKSEDEYFGIYNFSIDNDNNIYLISDRYIYILDKNGNHLFTAETEESAYINKVFITNKGDAIALYYDYSDSNSGTSTRLKKIDFDKKAFGEEYDISTIPSQYLYSILPSSDPNYDFFYNDDFSVYGYNMSAGVPTEIINWINSDIDNSYTNSFHVVSADEIICSGYNYMKNKSELMILERVPEDQVKEKYILKLASFGLDYNLKAYIIDFNRNNLEYRIQIEDYYKYNTDNDYEAGITKLNTDLISGKIPDILVVNTYNHLPIDSYIAKGMFADLNEFINNDPEINRSDYFENILDAAQTNGKLYRLFSHFYIQTVIGKAKFFKDMDGWTLNEFNQFMASQPAGTQSFNDMTQSRMLRRYITMMIDEFIDVNTGKCSFNNEGFIEVLELCKTFPANLSYYEDPNFDHEQHWRELESAYREERIMLMDFYLYEFEYLWDTMRVQFGEDIAFIGMPTPNRKGASFETPNEFMMASKTKHSDGVWSFLRQFIMDDYYESRQYYSGFPLKKSLVEKMADNAVNRANETLGGDGAVIYYNGDYSVAEIQGEDPLAVYAVEIHPENEDDTVSESENIEEAPAPVVVVEEEPAPMAAPRAVPVPVAEEPYAYPNKNIRYIDGVEVDIGFITREYTDMIINLIKNLDYITRYDQDMIDIIDEEAQGFFAGQKSAEETAKIIQNRLQNYVDERR